MLTETRVSFRPATPADLSWLLSTERASFSDPWTPGEMEEEFRLPYSRPWVAQWEGAPAAFGIQWFIAGESQLADIAVHPDYRRRGLGRQMMEWLLREAREAKMSKMTLEVREGNDAALALYRRLGFVETARRPRFYEDRHSAVLMEKSLV